MFCFVIVSTTKTAATWLVKKIVAMIAIIDPTENHNGCGIEMIVIIVPANTNPPTIVQLVTAASLAIIVASIPPPNTPIIHAIPTTRNAPAGSESE